ncbi:MAG TPA: flagellar hook protein FlgE [Terriglobales bacterium]|jgi:flagellar hook protein FlgE|nr:flagellar hook protein FlgE [Terriglobales bacterium]
MPLFSIPLSGLTASSNALSVISNNLANLNTVGYKNERVTFRDMFYQNIGTTGAGNPVQVGAGASVDSISSVFTSGNVETTGVPTDVAIMGEGFFVTQKDGGLQFTRAGNFGINSSGQLVTQDGRNVMGYPSTNGVIDPGLGLVPLELGQGQVSPPAATTKIQLRTNLDASAAVGSNYSTPLTVYDSVGLAHVLTFEFTKTASNAWDYKVTLPAADTGGSGTPTVLKSGSLAFDGSGNLTSPSGNIAGIAINNLIDGASAMNFDWNLADSGGSSLLTQVASPSTTSTTNQDGYGSGTLQTFAIIGSDGIIQGSFSNGQTLAIGQIALGNFPNNQGLLRTGGNYFLPTLASGAAVIGSPKTAGRGTLSGGALELSNVDISQEFTKMILVQRGFQANAKVVTTFDEITQDTINLKR